MRHKRSEASQQRRFIKRLVLQCAFQDRQRSETVNILSRETIAASASQAFDCVLPGLTNYERGEVLADSRGTGSLQR
jgi:hypothetical protein